MPELAEVEYFRRQWDVGLGQGICEVELRKLARLFRRQNVRAMVRALQNARLLSSETHGKQMLFRFSNHAWLGVHLGMTGELRQEPAGFVAGKHDHLVLRQRKQALVFRDARQFGRVLFHQGPTAPGWWSDRPPEVLSSAFTLERMVKFLRNRRRSPIKAVLLMQECFPGIGNWMADEILWRARIHPGVPAGGISEAQAPKLWKQIRWVSHHALRIVTKNYSDPPPSWLFRHRWAAGGKCPRDGLTLDRATIGGRTTVWCPNCQRLENLPGALRAKSLARGDGSA